MIAIEMTPAALAIIGATIVFTAATVATSLRNHACISRFVSMDRTFCSGETERYPPGLRRNRMYSTSFLTTAPGCGAWM